MKGTMGPGGRLCSCAIEDHKLYTSNHMEDDLSLPPGCIGTEMVG